jgi:predicted small lipoprotein YifL
VNDRLGALPLSLSAKLRLYRGTLSEPAVPTRLISLICLTLLALALGGCGRRGPLEPPPGTGADPNAPSVNTTSTMGGDINAAVPPSPNTPTGTNANPPPKGSSFFLDPLVK